MQIAGTITCCAHVIPAQVLCCPEIAQQHSQLTLCCLEAWTTCSISPKVPVHPILWLWGQIVVTQLISPPPRCDWKELCDMQWIAENCLLTCAVQTKKREKNNKIFFDFFFFLLRIASAFEGFGSCLWAGNLLWRLWCFFSTQPLLALMLGSRNDLPGVCRDAGELHSPKGILWAIPFFFFPRILPYLSFRFWFSHSASWNLIQLQ